MLKSLRFGVILTIRRAVDVLIRSRTNYGIKNIVDKMAYQFIY